MTRDEEMTNRHDRYKASSYRAYNGKMPERYDTSLAVRILGLSTWDEYVLGTLGQDVSATAILDVGCATGRLLEHLAGAGARRLSGSDLAPRILDVARGKLARFDMEPDLREADVETSLPWDADSFDAVTMTGVVHHLCRPEAAFGEIERVLRPGGTLIIADACFFPPLREFFNLGLRVHPHEGDHYFFTGPRLGRLLQSCGWEVGRCERLNWWSFGIVARRMMTEGDAANTGES
jgi:SAM-dependent methyltransferase